MKVLGHLFTLERIPQLVPQARRHILLDKTRRRRHFFNDALDNQSLFRPPRCRLVLGLALRDGCGQASIAGPVVVASFADDILRCGHKVGFEPRLGAQLAGWSRLTVAL